MLHQKKLYFRRTEVLSSQNKSDPDSAAEAYQQNAKTQNNIRNESNNFPYSNFKSDYVPYI